MDNELREILFDLKLDNTVLKALVKTILDSCELNYSATGLRIAEDDRVIAIIRAFYEDEYNNRFTELKIKAETEEI